MPNVNQAIKGELKNLEHTKNTFQNCERILRTAKFSGTECEQVAACIELIRFMVQQSGKEIDALRKKAKEVPAPQPAKLPDESGLGAHVPGVK